MKRLQFSVIIPTLNEEKFIGSLLKSLAQQTEKNFEVIVVDGRSKDKTLDVVNAYRRKLGALRIITSKKRLIAGQRNLGARVAKYNWLVFVDADTVLLPYFLERVGFYIKEKKPSLLTTWARPDSEVLGDALITLLANLSVEGSIFMNRPIAPGTLTLVERAAFNQVGGYDETHRYGEDVDLGRRLTDRGFSLHILPETLYVLSLRRFRREGTLKVLQKFALSVISILVIKRTPKYMPGYDLGGALYALGKPVRLTMLKKYERKLRQIMKELFE